MSCASGWSGLPVPKRWYQATRKPHTSGMVVPPEWFETSIAFRSGTFSQPAMWSGKYFPSPNSRVAQLSVWLTDAA